MTEFKDIIETIMCTIKTRILILMFQDTLMFHLSLMMEVVVHHYKMINPKLIMKNYLDPFLSAVFVRVNLSSFHFFSFISAHTIVIVR